MPREVCVEGPDDLRSDGKSFERRPVWLAEPVQKTAEWGCICQNAEGRRII